MRTWPSHLIGLAGGVAGVFGLGLRSYLTGSYFGPAKYTDFGGALLALFESALIFVVAYVFVYTVSNNVIGRRNPGRWGKDRNVLLGTGAVIAYLLYAANT